MLCGLVVAPDIDVPQQELADRIVHLFEERCGLTPLVRIGKSPKILLCYKAERPFSKIQTPELYSPLVRIGRAPKTLLTYRAAVPFAKLVTPELYLPDDTKAQVEILGAGQQFVADGIHPDTGQPYCWIDRTPADIRLDELPMVDEAAARELIAELEGLLREAGGREKEKEKPKEKRKPRTQPSEGGEFFRVVNAAALTDLGAWVEALFPTASFQPRTGAWRVASKDLGRDYQEDLSLHPSGIKDFGSRETLTAIDVVIEYHSGSGDAVAAALWLCQQLRVSPEHLGWRRPGGRQPGPGGGAPPNGTKPPGGSEDPPPPPGAGGGPGGAPGSASPRGRIARRLLRLYAAA